MGSFLERDDTSIVPTPLSAFCAECFLHGLSVDDDLKFARGGLGVPPSDPVFGSYPKTIVSFFGDVDCGDRIVYWSS